MDYNWSKSQKKINKIFGNNKIVLLIILSVGLTLRLINLSQEPFWGDEAFSLGVTRFFINDFSGLISYLKDIFIYPPFYFVLLKFWTAWFGYSEFAVRMISVIFGLGVIGIVYFFIKKIFRSEKYALLVSFFVAILPMQMSSSGSQKLYCNVFFWIT